VEQVARNLTDPVQGFLCDKCYLIHDRDPLFTRRFVEILEAAGVKSVKLPARSPNLNAQAERFVLSTRRECLNKIVPLGERHLRKIVFEFVDHCHRERNHQGLRNRLIEPMPARARSVGPIKCRERLGGVLNFYYRHAA
jgi:transposase InsO family protein